LLFDSLIYHLNPEFKSCYKARPSSGARWLRARRQGVLLVRLGFSVFVPVCLLPKAPLPLFSFWFFPQRPPPGLRSYGTPELLVPGFIFLSSSPAVTPSRSQPPNRCVFQSLVLSFGAAAFVLCALPKALPCAAPCQVPSRRGGLESRRRTGAECVFSFVLGLWVPDFVRKHRLVPCSAAVGLAGLDLFRKRAASRRRSCHSH
jgi:hypothetical protein